MHAYQFYIAPVEGQRSPQFILKDTEFRHCCRVLRKTTGDEIDVFDGVGHRWTAQIESIDKTCAECRIIKEFPPQLRLKPGLILGIGILKSNLIDEIVVNATALETNVIAFLHTVHSVKNQINKPRLEKLALTAAKQSGQAYLPQILALSMSEWFQFSSDVELKLIDERYDSVILSQIENLNKVHKIAVMIGPEGGFDESELRQARETGFEKVNIFSYRLRTELAAVMALAGLRTLTANKNEAQHGN